MLLWAGPFGMWLLIFVGLCLVIQLWILNDEAVTSRSNLTEVITTYNSNIGKLQKVIDIIQEEEKIRLSGDNDFTRTAQLWRDKIEKRVNEMNDKLDKLSGAKP